MKKFLFVFAMFTASCFSSENHSRFTDDDITSTCISESSTSIADTQSMVVIDLDDAFGFDYINIDNLIDTIYFLPLETTEDCLFHGVSKVMISGERIFVMDYSKKMLIFNDKGKYISQLSVGQGPGELIGVWDFTYDESRKKLIVYDESDYLKFYDINGNFVSEIKSPILFHEFCTWNGGFVLFQPEFLNMHLGEEARYALFFTDNNLTIKNKCMSVSEHGFTRHSPFLFKDDDRILISGLANDTIFELMANSFKAKYILKYNLHKADITDMDAIKTSSKYYHSSGYQENCRTQVFHFHSFKNGSYDILRDKASGNIIGGQSTECNFMLIPLCIPCLTSYNDFFVCTLQPQKGMHFSSSIISEDDNKKLEGLTDEDNVVLVFYKYKEF